MVAYPTSYTHTEVLSTTLYLPLNTQLQNVLYSLVLVTLLQRHFYFVGISQLYPVRQFLSKVCMFATDLPVHSLQFSAEEQSRTCQYIQAGRVCIASTETR